MKPHRAQVGWALWASALAFSCAGPTLVGRAQDRNPLLKPPDQVSEGIAIPTKDAQIIANAGQAVDTADPAHPNTSGYASTGAQYFHPTFHQSAIFQARSVSHLIFLVELSNRWSELTHAENYEVSLIDEQGHVFRPAEMRGEPAKRIFSSMVLGRSDVVHMVVLGTSAGTQVYTHGEDQNTDMKTMLGARTIIEFLADQPILTPQTRELKLRLKHRNRALEFIWDFRQ